MNLSATAVSQILTAVNLAHNSAAKAKHKKTRCETCGSRQNIVQHHGDYQFPLQVTYLCKSCHGNLHAEIRRQNRKRIAS